jgi:serine O-acetyltransferase
MITNWATRLRIRSLRPIVKASRRSSSRSVIERDIERWVKVLPLDMPMETVDDALCTYLTVYVEFRNVFYYRLEQGGGLCSLLAKLARRIWSEVSTFKISCGEIGPGFVVRHGYSTVLTAERIGANCFVHHEVTLGYDEGEVRRPPLIGDNVMVGVGAKVLGAITVGNDARIGANAVVLRDVPDGGTAVGVPARIIEGR